MERKFLLILLISVFSIATCFVVFFATGVAADYARILIINEQNDHYYVMQKNIQRLDYFIDDIETDLELLSKNKLDIDGKESLYAKLKNVENISEEVMQEIRFFQEDITVHIFFSPKSEITILFRQVWDTPLYTERFVRTVEQGLFESYVSRKQAQIIEERFEDLKSEINNINY